MTLASVFCTRRIGSGSGGRRVWTNPSTIMEHIKMKSLRKCAALACATLSFVSFDAVAAPDPNPDPNAAVVYLRKTCSVANVGAGESPVENCFETSSALHTWIWNTRIPTAASPLIVEIGPGTFDGGLSCTGPNRGHVTFRGSGRGNTIISSFYAGVFESCDALVFEHMTFSGALIGVAWFKGGSSSWTDVELKGGYIAWYDNFDNSSSGECSDLQKGTHKFFSSTLLVPNGASGGTEAIGNFCGKNWLWGSEIAINVSAGGGSTDPKGVLSEGDGNETHVYGGNIRVTIDAGAPVGRPVGISATNGAEVHVHGTGIDVVATNASNVKALVASSFGEIHASQSAYVLKAGVGGSVTRISSGLNGYVHAPYLWEHIPSPTTAPNFESVNGADTTTVTVGTSDGHPHMAVYSSTCPSNARWYDQVDKVCRSQ